MRDWLIAAGVCVVLIVGIGVYLLGQPDPTTEPDDEPIPPVALELGNLLNPPRPDAVATGLNPNHRAAVFPFALHNLTVSPDGRTLGAGDGLGRVHLWNLTQPREAAAVGAAEVRTVKAHDDWAFSVAFSADGTRFATAGGDNLVHLYAHEDPPRLIRTFTGHTEDAHAVAFTPDGLRLVSAGDDKSAIVWDIATGGIVHRLVGHERQIPALAVSPDGRVLATASRDGTIRTWTLDTGEPLKTLTGHTRDVMSVRFTPDGAGIASAGYDGTVRIWDAATGESLHVLRGLEDPAVWVAVSPDGATVAAVATHKAMLWDISTGEPRGSFVSSLEARWSQLSAVAFIPPIPELESHPALRIALSTVDGVVHLFDASTRAPSVELRAPAPIALPPATPQGPAASP